MTETLNNGGLTTEEAGQALSEALKQMHDDPYFQLFILPMMEERIRYSESWRGKLFPYSPLGRIKRDVLIWKIAFFFCIGVLIGLLILDLLLITMAL